jgi:magnesium transporter
MPDTSPVASDREEIAAALESGVVERITEVFEQAHPADIAECVEHLDEDERSTVLDLLPPEVFQEIVEFLPNPDVEKRLDTLSSEDRLEVLDSMADDELVDLLQDLEDNDRNDYIAMLPLAKRRLMADLLRFPEETAGGRMTTAYAKLDDHLTVAEAIELLREVQDETEVLSRIYVVDEQSRILGKVLLRDLTFSPGNTPLAEIMDSDQISIPALADQEEAAQMIARYDMVALPVVNEKSQLIGVITHDDAIEILEEESTEDIEKISGIGGDRGELSYLNTGVVQHIQRRFGWVLVLAFLAIISAVVLMKSEEIIKHYFILSLYMPMIVAAGGNTGSQAATMVIRAMSLGELGPLQFARVIWKELRIGLIIGCLLGICVALQVYFLLPDVFNPQNLSLLKVGLVVGISLAAQVATSTSIGATLPLAARAARLDPAVVASPAITTLVDVTGMIIYFGLAKWMLSM